MHPISEIIQIRNQLTVRPHTLPAVAHTCDSCTTKLTVLFQNRWWINVTPLVPIMITSGHGFMIWKNSIFMFEPCAGGSCRHSIPGVFKKIN